MLCFLPETDICIVHRRDAARQYMSPGAQIKKPHFHNQVELIMCLGGHASFSIAGMEYRIEEGDILCVSNMESHCITSHSAGYERYMARFSNEALSTLIHDPLLLSIFKQRPEGFCHLYRCQAEEIIHYRHMLDMMKQEYRRQQPYWQELIMSGMRNILVHMYRNNPDAFPGVRKQAGQMVIFDIQNYIESHLEQPLTLEAVARQFFISKFYLSHRFSAVTGYTFKEYVVMARLARAKDLLLHSDSEIQAIASAVGLSSASHFIRLFKRSEGISPLQYRNRSRKQNT
ncbi:MAG: helix-turn-helix transcriptional regulator [Clostridia bacterium]|nr:helix-turn-helix transcriptional regulator [Clostridia bacterium]